MNIAFIPVRGGSKSIPMKNIKPLFGKPLVYWAAAAAARATCIDKVVIATDSSEIKDCVLKLNLPKTEVYDRLPENANDTASTESVMLEYLKSAKLCLDDMLFLVQATSPLLQSEHIDGAFYAFRDGCADSLLTVVRNKRFYWKEEGQPVNYDFRKRPRRQDFKGTLMENGALYINSVENIRRDGNRLSGNVAVYEMPEYTGFEIDEPDDWFIIEQLMKKYAKTETPRTHTVRLFVTDVDGVLTDAGMYYGEKGDEWKKFNTRDAMGISLLRKKGIKTAIITSENTRLVERRAAKMQIDFVFQGVTDKAATLKELCSRTGISLLETAYIGDDINDLPAIELAGTTACPADAVDAIKAKVDVVLTKNGGHGAVREWCVYLLEHIDLAKNTQTPPIVP